MEIKNRRRLSRREPSIWEKVDLQAAGDQLAAEQATGEDNTAAPARP
ncbi:hypothetical protein [Rhizobium viscosum]|uniref:Uncharacterized protein n=1 Tax=Rhizobium viscosum TaxID=1673 RepID=A0ABR9IZY9_RHIVS|nr:hypothetical protein [Rhizobium viscosum]MBE1508782.1 hypothetical protein [Rhizobium viscosum]